MLFTLPKDVTFTDMAIYIDEHLPEIKENGKNIPIENKIFQYAYHLYYMLAGKEKYFDKEDDLDKYAGFAAGEFLLAARAKYIHKGETKRGKKVEPVKSSLNFIKATLFSCKVEYSRKFFLDVTKPWDSRAVATGVYLRRYVNDDYSYKLADALEDTFKQAAIIVKKVILDTPFKNDKLMVNRLYKTCLLSLINTLTLPNMRIDKAMKKDSKMKNSYVNMSLACNSQKDDAIILWHFDSSMINYIHVLLSRIKESISKELLSDIQSSELDDNTIDNILKSAYSVSENNQNNGLKC